jgi:hypothetical protein
MKLIADYSHLFYLDTAKIHNYCYGFDTALEMN